MLEALVSWKTLVVRGVLAIALAASLPIVSAISGNFVLHVMALPVLIYLFAVYVLLDSAVLLASEVLAPSSRTRSLIITQAILTFLIGIGFITVWFRKVTVSTVIELTIAQSFVTAVMELAIARRIHTHSRLGQAVFGAGVTAGLFCIALVILHGHGEDVLVNWLAAYALCFGLSELFIAARLRKLEKTTPDTLTARSERAGSR